MGGWKIEGNGGELEGWEGGMPGGWEGVGVEARLCNWVGEREGEREEEETTHEWGRSAACLHIHVAANIDQGAHWDGPARRAGGSGRSLDEVDAAAQLLPSGDFFRDDTPLFLRRRVCGLSHAVRGRHTCGPYRDLS